MSTAKRRDYGSGSVYQRADGRWIGAVLLAQRADGTRPRRTVSAKAEAQCKRKVRELIETLAEEGAAHGSTATSITVEQWAGAWLDLDARRNRPKSHTTNKSSTLLWVVPTIGKVRLSRVSPADLRKITDAMTAAGRSTSSALRAHVVALKMLKDAVVEGHVVPPRIFSMPAPRKATSDRKAIPIKPALDLLAEGSSLPDAARWVAALLQGMRQGECLGLTWDCVNLVERTIDVSWQLQAIPFKHGCGPTVGGKRPCGTRFGGDCHRREQQIPDGYEARVVDGALCLVRPKTPKGQRVIPMVPWMVDALAAWRSAAPHSLQAAAGVRHPGDRPYHLHEARHTTATLLLEAGVNPEVSKAILGHSSIVTSMGYAYVSQALARKALEDVAARLKLSGEPPSRQRARPLIARQRRPSSLPPCGHCAINDTHWKRLHWLLVFWVEMDRF